MCLGASVKISYRFDD